MPITQARMTAVLKAAVDCDEGRLKAIRAIAQAWENVKQGASPMQALEGLRMEFMYDTAGLTDARSLVVIATEVSWFERYGKVNDRNRRKQQRKRGEIPAGNSDQGPHPSTLARIRAADRLAEQERELAELTAFEDEELDARPKLDPSKCLACGHSIKVHTVEFGGCGMCECKLQGSESKPIPEPQP